MYPLGVEVFIYRCVAVVSQIFSLLEVTNFHTVSNEVTTANKIKFVSEIKS